MSAEKQAPTPRAFTAPVKAPGWKLVLAVVLDAVMLFVGLGFAIGWLTGQLTPNGFRLDGWPALLFYAIGFAYFYVGWQYAGGTVWDRILRIRRPQPR